ncbi:MAG: hypothetical protein J6S95_08365 [Lachnospiraceae bacterium]|nr:hypothetical protein [Lachnospiraceae bacterium]MBO7601144.1 hypothetical protein [Lachnospiraceae bacterium]
MNRDTYYYAKIRIRSRAKAFGIAAIASAIIFSTAPYIAIILGSFAVMFAMLGRGDEKKFTTDGIAAIATGLGAIFISIAVFLSVIYALKTNDEYRKNVGEYMDQIYGETYMDQSGMSMSEMLDQLLGERTD